MFQLQRHGLLPQVSLPHRRFVSLCEYARCAFGKRKALLFAALLVVNMFFQAFDGVVSHYVLAQDVPELNPFVDWIIQACGRAWGLILSKGFAIALLLFVFTMRNQQPRLAFTGLSLTAAAYFVHTLICSGELLIIFR